MADSMFTFPFGIHKDEDVEDVPSDYLVWVKGEEWFKRKFPVGFKAVKDELKYRERFGEYNGE